MNIKKIKEHLNYLNDISKSLISKQTAILAEKVWWVVWASTNESIDVPSACTGPNGKLFYEWNRGVHHFEIEFIPDKPTELFYRNRETGELWNEEYIEGPLSFEVKKRLVLVV